MDWTVYEYKDMKIEIDSPSGDSHSGFEIQWGVRDPRTGDILRDRVKCEAAANRVASTEYGTV